MKIFDVIVNTQSFQPAKRDHLKFLQDGESLITFQPQLSLIWMLWRKRFCVAQTVRIRIISKFCKRIWKRPHFREGVMAQAFYVGAQITCWTFVIHYGMEVAQLDL